MGGRRGSRQRALEALAARLRTRSLSYGTDQREGSAAIRDRANQVHDRVNKAPGKVAAEGGYEQFADLLAIRPRNRHDEEAHLDVYVEQERDFDGCTQAMPSTMESTSSGNHANTPMTTMRRFYKLERAARETHALEELEQRAAENEREIVRLSGVARS